MIRSLSIQSKMIMTAILPILLMGLVASYSTYSSISLANIYDSLFEKNIVLASLSSNLNSAEPMLATYLATKNSDALREYIHFSSKLEELGTKLEAKLIPEQGILLERDVAALVRKYLSSAQAAISGKRASRLAEYQEQHKRAKLSAAALRYTIDLLEDWHMEKRLALLSVFNDRIIGIQRLDLALMLALAVLDSLIVLFLSLRISTPIVHLSTAAKQIAAGNFDGPDIQVESRDEIGAMTEVFNRMKSGISRYVLEMKNKADIESSLLEQKLKNLEMANLLKHAELSSLQSRINPHFLFNTLNAGIQLSTLEGADKTRVFLENLSSLMRYSTRGLDQPAPLKEEFECVAAYAHLASTRFPGRILFTFNLALELESVPIPKLSIQPLLENSIKHGFGEGLPNARIDLRAYREGSQAVVEVEDNGVGFLPGTARKVFEAAAAGYTSLERQGQDDSVGLVNVIRRLQIFCGDPKAVEIDCARGIGALIRLRLRLDGGEAREAASG